MRRAFSPDAVRAQEPGAVPQAGMRRAVGPPVISIHSLADPRALPPHAKNYQLFTNFHPPAHTLLTNPRDAPRNLNHSIAMPHTPPTSSLPPSALRPPPFPPSLPPPHPSFPNPHSQLIVKIYRIPLAKCPVINEKPPL